MHPEAHRGIPEPDIWIGQDWLGIRRKALLSSVGFRKRMTSRSPRGIYLPVTHVRFCFDRPL